MNSIQLVYTRSRELFSGLFRENEEGEEDGGSVEEKGDWAHVNAGYINLGDLSKHWEQLKKISCF